MQRMDTEEALTSHYVNAMIYGKPGTGKTTFGVTASGLGPVLVLLSERQGAVHIKQAAQRLGVPLPRVLFMENLQDYRDVLRALKADRELPFRIITNQGEVVAEWETWPETVVLDSLTDLCARIMVDDIRRRAPQSADKTGLPRDADRFHFTLTDMVTNLIMLYRDAPVNTIFLCLLDDKMVGKGNNQKRVVSPKMPQRALPDTVAAAVNVIGATFRTIRDGVVNYGICTVGPDYMTLKPCAPLRNVEVPDFASWVTRLRGDDVELEEATSVLPEDLEGLQDPSDLVTEEGAQAEASAQIMCAECAMVPVDSEGAVCAGCEPEPETPSEEVLDNLSVQEAQQLISLTVTEAVLQGWRKRDSRTGVHNAIDKRLKALAKGRATVVRTEAANA